MKMLVQFDTPPFNMGWPGLAWQVQALSWSLPGGADKARLEAVLPDGFQADWLAWLNGGLVIATPSGQPVWGGFIEQVETVSGAGRRVLSTAGMVNRVKVRYLRSGFHAADGSPWFETDWLENAKSVARYGRREMLLKVGQSNAQQALAAGRLILAQRSFPQDRLQWEQQPQEAARVILTCSGWWHSLGWVIDEEAQGRIAHLSSGKSQLVLGQETATSKLGQSFVVPVSGFQLAEVRLRLALVGNPLDGLVLAVCADGNGQPGAILAGAVLPASELNGSWTWAQWSFNPPVTLAASSRYWLVLRRSAGAQLLDYYKVESDDGPGYADGVCKRWQGSQWQLLNEDMCFACFAAAPLSELIHQLAEPQRGGQFLRFVRLNLPQTVQTLRWRPAQLSCAERLENWLALASTQAQPVSAVVNHQRALAVFPIAALPAAAPANRAWARGGADRAVGGCSRTDGGNYGS